MPITFDQAAGLARNLPVMPGSSQGMFNYGQLEEQKRAAREREAFNRELEQNRQGEFMYNAAVEQELEKHKRQEVYRLEVSEALDGLQSASEADDYDAADRWSEKLKALGMKVEKPESKAPTLDTPPVATAAPAATVTPADQQTLQQLGAVEQQLVAPTPPAVLPGGFDAAAQGGPIDRAIATAKRVVTALTGGDPNMAASVNIPVEKDKAAAQAVTPAGGIDTREAGDYIVKSPDGTEVFRSSGAARRLQNRAEFDKMTSETLGAIKDGDLQKDARKAAEIIGAYNLPIQQSRKVFHDTLMAFTKMTASERNAQLMASVRRQAISVNAGRQRNPELSWDSGNRRGTSNLAATGTKLRVEAYDAVDRLLIDAAANNGVANNASIFNAVKASQGPGPVSQADFESMSPRSWSLFSDVDAKVRYVLSNPNNPMPEFTDEEKRAVIEFGIIQKDRLTKLLKDDYFAARDEWETAPEGPYKTGLMAAARRLLKRVPGLDRDKHWGGRPFSEESAPGGSSDEEAEQDADMLGEFGD